MFSNSTSRFILSFFINKFNERRFKNIREEFRRKWRKTVLNRNELGRMKEEGNEVIINSGIRAYPRRRKRAKEEGRGEGGGKEEEKRRGERNVRLTRVEMKVNIGEEEKKTEDMMVGKEKVE